MSVSAEESAVKVWRESPTAHRTTMGVTTKSFSYDRVFSSSETTNHLYQDIAKPLVVSAVEGYNGTIFAYGQTSSGKTFTMMGSKLVPGVIPLSMEEVFQTIQNYNETVPTCWWTTGRGSRLEVREALNKNIYVADLTEELVTCLAQALSWVFTGENQDETRRSQSLSHLFRMILESREKSDPASGDNSEGAIIVSHLEPSRSGRVSTGQPNRGGRKAATSTEASLPSPQVIKKLSDESQRGFTNYRDSKLTRILQNSWGATPRRSSSAPSPWPPWRRPSAPCR
ncbi:unnamed protein product [Boreogadus saida]